MSSYSPSQFVVTLSAGTTSTIGTDVKNAVSDNIGNIYEDDEAEPPNYSTLPSFWSTEVKDVSAYTSSSPSPSPSPSPLPSPTKSTPSSGGSTAISSGATTKPSMSASAQHLAATITNVAHTASGTTTEPSSQPTTETATSTISNSVTSANDHTLNPFIRVRDVLFQNYKGSKTVSDIGTAVVFLIPIAVVSFLLRLRIVSLFMRFTKFNKT